MSRSISVSLDRNRDKYQHEFHTKVHSETLSATLQSLNLSHQETLNSLQHKLSEGDHRAHSLSDKLAVASAEIQHTHEAFRDVKARLSRIEQERKDFEDQLIKERSQTQKHIAELQRELIIEREVDRLLLIIAANA